MAQIAPGSRVQSVRLPTERILDLETLAGFDGVSVAQEIREAVELLIEHRKNDPEFVARVRERFARTRRLLESNGERSELVEVFELGSTDQVEQRARAGLGIG